MNVLVTGGAGYIGSHAVRRLLRAGHRVTVLDNLSHGHRQMVDPEALFVEGDIEDAPLIHGIVRESRVQAALHFAADIEVGESVRDPHKYYVNNFTRALAMLNALRTAGVKKLLFSSTAAVYGDPLEIPIAETHPRNPISPYGRAKMMTEMAIEDFGRAYGTGYAILRYFNVAGASPDGGIGEAHEPESHLIPRVLSAALGLSPAITVYGTDYATRDGTCIRDYVHVEDLAQAHVLALERIREGGAAVYNLGSESGFSVLEVIESCRRVTGLRIAVREQERRAGDPEALIASSAKIRRELGWERKYPDLDGIVSHAWEWHRRLHGKTNSDQARRPQTDSLQPPSHS